MQSLDPIQKCSLDRSYIPRPVNTERTKYETTVEKYVHNIYYI